MIEPISQEFLWKYPQQNLAGSKTPVRHTNFTPNNSPVKIIMHHSGGTDKNPLADTQKHTAEIVRAWHLSKGWDDIGYHIVTEDASEQHPNGRIVLGRPFNHHGAHCWSMNQKSIGWLVMGNFDRTHRPSYKQKRLIMDFYAGNLKKVWIFDRYGNTVEIDNPYKNLLSEFPNLTPDKAEPHRKYQTKTC